MFGTAVDGGNTISPQNASGERQSPGRASDLSGYRADLSVARGPTRYKNTSTALEVGTGGQLLGSPSGMRSGTPIDGGGLSSQMAQMRAQISRMESELVQLRALVNRLEHRHDEETRYRKQRQEYEDRRWHWDRDRESHRLQLEKDRIEKEQEDRKAEREERRRRDEHEREERERLFQMLARRIDPNFSDADNAE